jgi:MYXO-CTERM domain-containing protein
MDPVPAAISQLGSDQMRVALAFDGKEYLAVWEDTRDGTERNLYGTRLSSIITALDGPAGFLVSSEPSDEQAPALASDGFGRVGLAYERYVGPPLNGSRVRLRLIGQPAPLGSGCETDAQCASGFCADGVCCDTACGGGQIDCMACSVAQGAAAVASCGRPWRYSESGRPEVTGTGPFEFRLRALDDQGLPDGLYINSETGELSWLPTKEQAGRHRFQVVARAGTCDAVEEVTVEVQCGGLSDLLVSCGCSSGDTLLPLWALLWAGLLRRRYSERMASTGSSFAARDAG